MGTNKTTNGNDHAPQDIRTWRESMGYSNEEAASMLGISEFDFLQMEHGKVPTPRYIKLAAAALALGIKA